MPLKSLTSKIVLLLLTTWQASAVTFALASAGPPTWTYTLTFGPEDNCNLFVSPSTITLSGLTGVTAAGAPTSTDFPAGPLANNNMNWTPVVSGGGTVVTWTNPTCGSGNFPTPKNVFGFTVTAPTAPNGSASFATRGFARDTGTANSVDASGSVGGPAPATSVPVLSPIALLVTMVALGLAGAFETRRRFDNWFRKSSL